MTKHFKQIKSGRQQQDCRGIKKLDQKKRPRSTGDSDVSSAPHNSQATVSGFTTACYILMDIRCVLLERASPFRSKWLNCIVLIVEINVDATIDVENDFISITIALKSKQKQS